MKSLSVALAAHFALETTQLATCWKVTRLDGEVFGFTAHDADLTVGGVTYAASTGYVPSQVSTGASLAVDNLNVQGVVDSAVITEGDLQAGLWDYAAVEIFEVIWSDPDAGTHKLRKGYLGEVRLGRVQFEAELNGLLQLLQQEVGRLYMPACQWDLGDSRCTVNLDALAVNVQVTSVTSARVFACAGLAQAAGYFDAGLVTWQGSPAGLNDGLRMEIKTHTAGGAIALCQPMPYAVAVGDSVTIRPGCDRTRATCNTKFSNVLNFGGFPDLPGRDRMLSGT